MVVKPLALRGRYDSFGNTALIEAASFGRTDTAKLLLDRGADINAINDYGGTAVISAARFWPRSDGNTDTVKLLLDRGSDINAVDASGTTALILAAEYAPIDTVRLLLKMGADINAINDYGSTALSVAQRGDRTEIVKILEETPEIKQLVDNVVQGDLSSRREIIERIKDLNIDSYEFNLILNSLINKIKDVGVNRNSRKLLLDLAQHIALYLQSLGPDVIELPYEMLEVILRDILSNTDFNFEFEIAHDESGKPITENLIGLVKAFRFPQKVAAFRTRLKEQPVIKTRKEKQSCQLM